MSLSRSGRLEPEFLSSQLQCLILGTFQSQKTTKNQKKKKKRPPSLPWKTMERTLFQPWFVNGKFLNRLTSLSSPGPQSALRNSWPACHFPLWTVLHWTHSLEQPGFHLNKALLDLVTGVEWVLNGVETPQYSQRSGDFPESTKTLEMTTKSLLNDSLQSPDPITHGHSTKRWGRIDRGSWGGEGSWECLKGSQISGQWQRRATQGWMRRVFANPSAQRNSPTFSFLLSPPTDCQQYLLIFCCLVTWSAYLFPHSHFLPGQRKRHFLVVGQSCWVNHSGQVRSRVTKLRREKRTPRWNLNFR